MKTKAYECIVCFKPIPHEKSGRSYCSKKCRKQIYTNARADIHKDEDYQGYDNAGYDEYPINAEVLAKAKDYIARKNISLYYKGRRIKEAWGAYGGGDYTKIQSPHAGHDHTKNKFI
jgi:endogenous inhibitor of DNA gyrase (YacG/DUF329 family)